MENRVYENWMSDFVENLTDHFNFNDWDIETTFLRQIPPGDEDVYAKIGIDIRYLRAEVCFSPMAQEDFEKGRFHSLVKRTIHEMAHIFLAVFADEMEPFLAPADEENFSKLIEQQTQRLTRVFLKTLPDYIVPPRPDGEHNTTTENDQPGPADDSSVPPDVCCQRG